MKKALVLGAGGFIGNHMVNRLKSEGYWVRAVDLKLPEFNISNSDEFIQCDLSKVNNMDLVIKIKLDSSFDSFDEVYQFAADMGGAGYIFTGENDANIMSNSALINLNLLNMQKKLNNQINKNKTKIFYSSSACIYPRENQVDPNNPNCEESSAYPANPDSEYGWEKLFSERLYLSFNRNYKIPVAIARYHNVYGPLSKWDGGKEKAPSAICRKVIESNGEIEIWGDGSQTRSFLHIQDCIDATRILMKSDFTGPINIGSEEMITINYLVDIVESIENKKLNRKYLLDKPVGVASRNSDNKLINKVLNWNPSIKLSDGIRDLYFWIKQTNDNS